MVYIFGLDIPLIEVFFILLIIGIILAAVIVYIIVKIMQMNKKMDYVLSQEKKKLVQFSDITEKEKKELADLRKLERELDDLLDQEEDAVKALEKLKTVRKTKPKKKAVRHEPTSSPVEKGKDFVKALLGATMRHEEKPVWRTEKWRKEGLVLVLRNDNGSIKEWRKHPLSGIPESQVPWKKEHWYSEGDVAVLRRPDGTLIDWEKLKK